MSLKLTTLCGAIAFTLLQPISAGAHGIWTAERWGELGLIYGHGAGDDPYDPAKITEIHAIAENGKDISVEVENHKTHAILKPTAEPAAIAINFDNGYWTERNDGSWVNQPKNQVEGAKSAGHYVKSNLSLLHLHGELPAFPQQTLQILPLDNPIGRKAGDKIRLQVLFEGKPLPEAVITLDYVNRNSLESEPTDGNGEVTMTLANDGLNVLSVGHSKPLENDPAADKVGYNATLSFVAAGHSHE